MEELLQITCFENIRAEWQEESLDGRTFNKILTYNVLSCVYLREKNPSFNENSEKLPAYLCSQKLSVHFCIL